MNRTLARIGVASAIVAVLSAGCTAKSDPDTTTTAAAGSTVKGSVTKSSAAPVSTLGTSGDPASPTAFCDAAKAFLEQQKVALRLSADQRKDFEPIVLANIDVLQSQAPAAERAAFDTYLNAWREFLAKPVGQAGRKIPPFDPTLNAVRAQWKGAIDRDCGTGSSTKSTASGTGDAGGATTTATGDAGDATTTASTAG